MIIQKETKLACDFCAKDQDQLQKLIRGIKDVCICDECVAVCVDIIKGADPLPAVDPSMIPLKEDTP